MGGLVNGFELLNRDLGVNLGGVEVLMAQQRLDKADIRAVIEHVGGAGVAQQVTRAGRVNAGLFESALDLGAQGASSITLALVVEE